MEFAEVVRRRRMVRHFASDRSTGRSSSGSRPPRSGRLGRLQPGPAGRDRHRAGPDAAPGRARGRGASTPSGASTRGSARRRRCSSRASRPRSTSIATTSPTSAIRRRRRETEDEWTCRTGGWTSAARSCSSSWRRSTRVWRRGSPAATSTACEAELGMPEDFTPVGVIPVGRPLADKKSPSLKRGWRGLDEFARWETW